MSLLLPPVHPLWAPPRRRPAWRPRFERYMGAYHGQAKCKCCGCPAALEVDLDLSGSTTCTICQASGLSKITTFPDPSGVYVVPFDTIVGASCRYILSQADAGSVSVDTYSSFNCIGGPTTRTSIGFEVRVLINSSTLAITQVTVTYLGTYGSALAFQKTSGSLGSPISNGTSCSIASLTIRTGGTATVSAA